MLKENIVTSAQQTERLGWIMQNPFIDKNCWNKTYCGDNLTFLQQMKESKIRFNLIIADAPYNIGKDFGNDSDRLEIDRFLSGLDERLSIMKDLLSANGSIILFCTHLHVGRIQLLLEKYFHLRRLMIWFYENGMSRQTHEPVTEYEPFWWFSATQDGFIYNLDDVRVPYKTDRVRNPVYKMDSKGNKIAWIADPRGRKRGDVWQYPTLAGKYFENERTEHPTQKPMSFFLDLIRAFGSKGINGKYECNVLDPYMGSGTTAAACERLNREGQHNIKWMGCEMNTKWVDICNSRVDKERGRFVEPDIFSE